MYITLDIYIKVLQGMQYQKTEGIESLAREQSGTVCSLTADGRCRACHRRRTGEGTIPWMTTVPHNGGRETSRLCEGLRRPSHSTARRLHRLYVVLSSGPRRSPPGQSPGGGGQIRPHGRTGRNWICIC